MRCRTPMCLNASACRSAACEPDNRRCIRACDASSETSAPGPCGCAVSVDDCHGGRKKLSGEKRLIFQLPSVHARREGGGIGKELRGRARWCERSHRDAEMSRSINDELALHNSAQRQPRVRSRGMSSPRIAPRAIRATVSRPPLPHPGARMTPASSSCRRRPRPARSPARWRRPATSSCSCAATGRSFRPCAQRGSDVRFVP